ncbi:hypothetical protein CCR95_16750 [Thiocystis minor]|nr:hypothetical protein [Thiocystis minor]
MQFRRTARAGVGDPWLAEGMGRAMLKQGRARLKHAQQGFDAATQQIRIVCRIRHRVRAMVARVESATPMRQRSRVQ